MDLNRTKAPHTTSASAAADTSLSVEVSKLDISDTTTTTTTATTTSSCISTRTRSYGCSEEPDVQVVVGGKVFYEYSQILCCISDYFDAALVRCSTMKEASTKEFEFPERDPEEWQFLMDIMAPASRTRLPPEKLLAIFRWADELCIPQLPLQCDDLWANQVLAQLYEYHIDPNTKKATKLSKPEYYAKLIDACEISIRFQLQRSFNGLFAILSQALNSEPHELTLDSLQQLLSWMNQEKIRNLFWPFLEQYLPENVNEKYDTDKLLDNELFPHLLYCHMQFAGKEGVNKAKAIALEEELKKHKTLALW